MSDIHALSGAYALDALDDLERHAFEKHLTGCPICRDEVTDLTETSTLLAELCDSRPSPELRARVLAEVATSRPLPPVVVSLHDRANRHRKPRRITGLVAAAAAVLAVGVGGTVVFDATRDDAVPVAVPEPEVSAVDQVLAAPDAERFSQDADGGGTVTIVRSKTLNQAVLQTSGLADVPSDKTRELWLLHGSEYLPAGYLPAGSDHTLLLDGDPASAKAFGMTIEQASGASSPSEDIVALMPFKDA